MKVLSFDLSGRFAYFKKFSATSSGLTFSCIPKTAVQGLIGAIIGDFYGDNGKEVYLSHFSQKSFLCSVEVLHDNHKQNHSLNYRKVTSLGSTKPNDSFPVLREDIYSYKDSVHTPTPVQFLINPKFRIHVWIEDEVLYETLKDRLFTQSSYYPLNMGSSHFPAYIDKVAENEAVPVSLEEPVDLLLNSSANQETVVLEKMTFSTGKSPILDSNTKIQYETHPLQLERTEQGRKAGAFHKIVFSCNKPLPVKMKEYHVVEDKNVVFY